MPKTLQPTQQGFEKLLYHHHILEASKVESTDSNFTILEGTAIKFDIFGMEWL